MNYDEILKEVLKIQEDFNFSYETNGFIELSEKMVKCMADLQRVCVIFSQILLDECNKKVLYEKKRREIELKFSVLLTDDEEVKSFKNQELREAKASQKIQKEKEELDKIELELIKLKTIKEVVETKMGFLKNAYEAFSRQLEALKNYFEMSKPNIP